MKQCRRFTILPLLLLFAYPAVLFGQVNLTGVVKSSNSKQPLPSANVYISNSSSGVVTDSTGRFLIRLPNEKSELVFSCVGFQIKKLIVDYDMSTKPIEVELLPKIVELNEVIVESFEKDGWQKYGRIFLDNFIGSSDNSFDCKILNPDAIKFHFGKKSGILKVTADQRMEIQNLALGYVILYDLVKFEFDTKTKTFEYEGFPVFKQINSPNKTTNDKWIRNRKDAFEGSIMHFMRSLVNNESVAQQFEVRKYKNITVEDVVKARQFLNLYNSKSRLKQIFVENGIKSKVLTSDNNILDSIEYYKQIMAHEVGDFIVINKKIDIDSLIFQKKRNSVQLLLNFDLNIIYKPKQFLREYLNFSRAENNVRNVSSTVHHLGSRPITIQKDGSYYEAQELFFSGFWAWWTKICNKLPNDYVVGQ